MINSDPVALIESPKTGRGLPKALTENQIDALLAAPDTGTMLGMRDKAMLELMYATGLRVSELVSALRSRLHLVSLVDGGGRLREVCPAPARDRNDQDTTFWSTRPELRAINCG